MSQHVPELYYYGFNNNLVYRFSMRTPPITPDEVVEHQEDIQNSWEYPQAQGLYNPNQEHEACGVGFIAAIDGKRCHKILRDAETLSLRMNHRGACACDNDTGQSKHYPTDPSFTQFITRIHFNFF